MQLGRCACVGSAAPIHGLSQFACCCLLLCRAFKTVVFVIDQVDAFVQACKQTLLYNVLDALTSSQVQVSWHTPSATDSHLAAAAEGCCYLAAAL